MCVVDGKVDIVLVPHVNRQEVYAGDDSLVGSVYDQFSKVSKRTKDMDIS